MRALMFTVLVLGLTATPVSSAFHPLQSEPRSMFELYEENRRQGIPNYITEDFLLLSYSLLLDQALGLAEETRLGPSFGRLVERLSSAVSEQSDTEIRLANQRFLAVVAALLVGEAKADSQPVDNLVRDEFQQVLAAEGPAFSELMVQRLDYSQFQVRGRYAATPDLERYFRAVRYAGTVLFPAVSSPATGISAEQADRLTAQALQLTSLIAGNEEISSAWQELTGQLEWWFGPADDLGIDDYGAVAATKKKELSLANLRQALLDRAKETGRQPRILGGLVELDQLAEGQTASDVLTGWRFFPQRFTPDGAALQQLVHGSVGPYLGPSQSDRAQPKTLSFAGGQPVKGLPSALELMTLLGSKQAGEQLDATDERRFEGYGEAAERASHLLAESQGLTAEHFSMLRFWLEGDPNSERRVTSAMAFWTYHRYANLLYAKPSYSGVAKGFQLPPQRRTAWLEPAAELYARLARSSRLLSEKADCFACGELAGLLERCMRIAVLERAGLELGEDDVAFLNDLDFEIFKLTGQRDEPIVVDIHTDGASGQVMQEGLGWPRVVEKPLVPGKQASGKQAPGEQAEDQPVSRGALFRHYEFKRPLTERLTDVSWTRMLEDGKIPPGDGMVQDEMVPREN